MNDFFPSDVDFRAQHPGISIREEYLPADETAQALITGSDAFNLLVVSTLKTDFSSMLEKGYYVDLSGTPEIADYMTRLYPVWARECMVDGHIAAIPMSAMSGVSLEYNKRIWEEEALGDVPTTYEELFDFVERWLDSDLSSQYTLFGPVKDTFSILLDRILCDYVALGESQQQTLPFHDEKLLHLLDRLEKLRPALERLEMQYASGDPLFYENGFATKVYRLVPTSQTTDYAALPVALWQDVAASVPAELYVMLVNPHSANQELAKAYLANLTQHPTSLAQCVLLQGQPEGVSHPGNTTETYEAEMESVRQELAIAQENHDLDLAASLEQELDQLTHHYLYSWDVMPDVAAKLYAITPYWAVMHKQGYGFLQRNATTLLNAYQDGQLPADTLTKRIDQLIQMEQMEDK